MQNRKMSWFVNLGKLKKNTTCMKENKGSLIFFHHLQVSMRSFSSSIRKTSQFLLCWNSYGWSNILFVLGRASKRSSLLLNLEELNFVDISPDWTYSSTRFVSLFLIRRWGRISQCCVVSEYWMKWLYIIWSTLSNECLNLILLNRSELCEHCSQMSSAICATLRNYVFQQNSLLASTIF